MNSIKEIILNFKEEDYFGRVNLHIHSNCSDGVLSGQEIVQQARQIGLEYISITDHNTLETYKGLDLPKQKWFSDLEKLELSEENVISESRCTDSLPTSYTIEGVNLIPGVEFDCWHKSNFLHILGYGVDIKNEELLDLCAKDPRETRLDIIRIFSSRRASGVIKAIKNAGGIAVLAHPACCWAFNLEKMVEELIFFGLDGIELYYPYVRHRGIIKFHSVEKIKKISKKNKILVTGGTDCHKGDLASI